MISNQPGHAHPVQLYEIQVIVALRKEGKRMEMNRSQGKKSSGEKLCIIKCLRSMFTAIVCVAEIMRKTL